MSAVSALLPIEEGSMIVYLNPTSTDQAQGFGWQVRHSIGRDIMAEQIYGILHKLCEESGEVATD